MGSDPQRFVGGAVCENRPVRAQPLEDHVWKTVTDLLQDPRRVFDEWSRRRRHDGAPAELQERRDEAIRNLTALERGLQRLVDAYEVGAVGLEELKARSDAVRARMERARREVEQAERAIQEGGQLRLVIAKVEDFGARVRDGLNALSWHERQHIIRTLVARVEIDETGATVVFRVPATDPGPAGPDTPSGSSSKERRSSKSYGLRTGRNGDLPPELHPELTTPKRFPQCGLGRRQRETHLPRALLYDC